jgi:zinc protease
MAEALPAAEQLLRQALQYGFSQAELDEQIKEYRVSNENAVKSEPTRSSGAIVSGHLSELSPYKSVLTTAAWRLAEWQKFEKQIKLKDVNSAFVRTYGRLDKGLIFASGKPENVPDNAALAALLAKSRAVAVKAPEQQAKLSFAYTNFGTPGTIAADSTIKDVDIRTIRFANGVMLNLKKTPYDASRVLVSMAVDGGNLLLPKNKASYENLGDLIGSGGLGKHKLDDLQSLTAGTSAGAGFGTSEDSFVSSANVVQKDLLLQLQLMAAYVTDPGYRDEAITRWRKTLPEFYARLDATPGSTLGNRSAPILYGDDPRYKLAPIEELQALNWAEYRSLIGDALSKNAIEMKIAVKPRN